MAQLGYYEKNKENINKNKILNRVNLGHKINEKTIKKYSWSINQTSFLYENVIKKKVSNRYNITKEDAKKIINEDDKIKNSSKNLWTNTLNTLYEIFDDDNLGDIFKKNDNETIVEKIKEKYENMNSSIRHMNVILKMYNLSNVFKKIMTKKRYDKLSNIVFDMNQKSQSGRIDDKQRDRTDYISSFINMFENEMHLRKFELASNNHIVSVIYTIGCFTKQNLEAESLVYVPRVDELENVELVINDIHALNTNKNYYNYITGRLMINNLKTTNDTNSHFKYDHIINPLAQKIIKINIDNRIESKKIYLFPFKKQQIENKLKDHVLSNRILRKAYQNIYEKLNLRKLDSMSRVLAHNITTATSSYLNSKIYTESELIIVKEKMNS